MRRVKRCDRTGAGFPNKGETARLIEWACSVIGCARSLASFATMLESWGAAWSASQLGRALTGLWCVLGRSGIGAEECESWPGSFEAGWRLGARQCLPAAPVN